MAKPIASIRFTRAISTIYTGLGHILRQQFGLQITACEEWTLNLVNEWDQCSDRGNCSWHKSQRYESRLSRAWASERTSEAMSLEMSLCEPWHMSVYTGSGRVEVAARRADLRVHIERTRSDVFGDLFMVNIWIRLADNSVIKGRFGLHKDGLSYAKPDDQTCPDLPPSSLAFSRQAVEASN
jgi:hypothetical protein